MLREPLVTAASALHHHSAAGGYVGQSKFYTAMLDCKGSPHIDKIQGKDTWN